MSAQEIREALAAHAAFDDTAALARLGSIKARVRVVRRRRRVALAGAAAAVVAVVGGVATLVPGEREATPVSRVFGDLTAPRTMSSGGATYTFDRMVTGTGRLTVDAEVKGPVLVSWATADDGAVTIERPTDGSPRYTSREDFGDFLSLDNLDEQAVEVSGTGRLALAVYRFSTPASGAQADVDGTPMVLRDELPGFASLGAAWGEPGATELTMTFTYPARELAVSSFCAGAKGYELHVDVEGPGVSSICSDTPSVHGPGDRMGFNDGLTLADGSDARPGDRITARLWLSRKGSDEPVTGPVAGVRMGVAAYETEPSVGTIGQWDLTELREEAGHTWRFVRLLPATETGRHNTVAITVTDQPQLVLVTASEGSGRASMFVDGQPSTTYDFADSGGGFLTNARPFGPGSHTVSLRTQRPGTMWAAVYEQVD